MLRYPALSSLLVLLLRAPGDTHPKRHVIVYVSRDEVSYLPWKFSFYFSLDGDRSMMEFFMLSMCQEELHE
jgi:hypothetical protein